MLINEEPANWSAGLAGDVMQMFPELGSFEEEAALPADDFLEALSSGLEIPLLLNGEGSPSSYDESPDDIMRSALEDIDFGFVQNAHRSPDPDFNELFSCNKRVERFTPEPCSPLPPSPSPSQSESSSNSEWQSESGSSSSGSSSEPKFALETPPISPPQNESPSISPPPAQNNQSLLQPVKLLPLGSLNLKNKNSQKFFLSNNNPAKRICIQPKLENSTGKETPRKTIVLSPQDFAALTQRVKQNCSNQPLKVQALPMSRHVKLQNQVNLLPSQQTIKIDTNPAALPQKNLVNAVSSVQIQHKTPIATIQSDPIVKNDSEPNSQVIIKKENVTNPAPLGLVIKNKVPAHTSVTVTKENPNCTPIVIKNEFPELINYNGRQDSELKAMKRQQRMIKNRESACLSRKKKKEYVTSLENQIAELQERNNQLESENAELKKRLSAIEEFSGQKFRSKIYSVNKKNTTILLAMVFMVSFNFGGLGNVFNHNRQPLEEINPHVPQMSVPNLRHGRTLLWSDNQDDTDSKPNLNDTLPIHRPMCPMHINRTESIRLDSELRRWIGGESDRETKSNTTDLELKSTNKLLHLEQKPDERPKFSTSRRTTKRLKNRSRRFKVSHSQTNTNAVQVFAPLLKEHAKLFDALGRRDDTFYVVWFTGDHLLLPASSKNSTFRPKMSLILPAVPVNGSYSTPPNHVTMMQIDCEVTNTQLLHLQEAIIPKHLKNQRQPETNSPKYHSTEMSENIANSTKSYKPYFLRKNTSKDSLHNNNFNGLYPASNKNRYNDKEPNLTEEKFNKNLSLKDTEYNSYSENDQKKSSEFANQTEELKPITYPQVQRRFRNKFQRSDQQ